MPNRKLTDRRSFLRATGAAATAGPLLGLAGCASGGDDGGEGSPMATDTPEGSTPAGSSTPGPKERFQLPDLDYDLEDTLNVFQWADYWPTGTVEAFEAAYGVTVQVSNYASNEEMFNKLNAGGTGQFDVIFPSDYMVNILISQEMVQPLDLAKIPHWENLEAKWVDEAPYDSGSERYSAPYQWGTSGIASNSEVSPDADVTTWDTLWNEQFADQITMLDDMRESIGVALKRLGYSLNTTNESEIEEAKQLLIEQKPLLLTYDSVNMGENLINGSASPIHTWSGSAFVAYWELYSEGSSPIEYQVPQQGGVVWVDTACITDQAAHPNAAHAFINFVLNARVNAMITNYVYYATPNAAAKEYVDQAALDNPSIYPPESTMQNLEFIRNVGDATQLYSEAWTEVKNA